jgi:hypothetical protein
MRVEGGPGLARGLARSFAFVQQSAWRTQPAIAMSSGLCASTGYLRFLRAASAVVAD